MKQLFVWLCLLCSLGSGAQNIIAAEYFIDTDPGIGNATAVPVGVPGSQANFFATVSTAGLSQGFHFLGLRSMDNAGHWGLFEQRGFYISSPVSVSADIVAAESFIDVDPGAGNGVPAAVGTAGNSVSFVAAISTTSLSPGFHFLCIRARDLNGNWGLFEQRGFYISAATSAAANIVAAEAFIDIDPGVGNGTPLAIGTPGSAVSFIANLPSGSLSPGFHFMCIRVRDGNGHWGLFEQRGFYISAGGATMGNITAAEYFIDADPGVGNGSPLVIASPGSSISESFLVAVPPGTVNGQHLVAIRARDVNGIWGLFELMEFSVVGSALPLDWISFTATRQDQDVLLKWITENETSTAYFDVERSGNGIDFHMIGKQDAWGQDRNEYSFTDSGPLKGLNFYRLKQYDQDGSFKYSVILKIYFGDRDDSNLKLYPNPTSRTLSIEFGGTGNELIIQVYDAAGRSVLSTRMANSSTVSLPVVTLKAGSYWITVSDGLLLQKAQFVKTE